MKISTLGPHNTNSQFAAEHYLRSNNFSPDSVILRDTPEMAIEELKKGNVDKTILCVVYPKLNDIVFQNLQEIEVEQVFRFNTDHMVVATHNSSSELLTACSHPAPTHLLAQFTTNIDLVNSNSQAASLVAAGEYDLCVSTLAAAKEYDLEIVKDFGPVPMGWAVFGAV